MVIVVILLHPKAPSDTTNAVVVATPPTSVATEEQPNATPTAQPVAEVKPEPKPVEAPKPAPVAVAPPPAPASAPAPSGSCLDWMQQAGVTDIANATWLIHKESGCRPNAVNPSSGACGIPQALPCGKLASAGADWGTNPVTQIKWMQTYVTKRYGTWAKAVAFHKANNWY